MINFQDNTATLSLWTLAKYLLSTWETLSYDREDGLKRTAVREARSQSKGRTSWFIHSSGEIFSRTPSTAPAAGSWNGCRPQWAQENMAKIKIYRK